MGVEAARLALRSAPAAAPDAIWFATATPAYLDKTNATAIHAALRQPSQRGRLRLRRRPPLGVGRAAGRASAPPAREPPWSCWPTSGTASHVGPTRRPEATGPPPSWWGTTDRRPVIAEYLGGASVSDEFLDRWRTAGDRRSQVLGGAVRRDPVRPARRRGVGVGAEGRRRRAPTRSTGWPSPACTAGRSGPSAASSAWATGRWPTIWPRRSGRPVPPTPAWCWRPCSSSRRPGQVVAVVSLADGADVLVFRTTEALASWTPADPVADQIDGGADLRYGKFLSWRGMVTPEPPGDPSPSGSRPRPPGATRTGSSASSVPATAPRRPCTCLRPGSR